MWNKWAFYLAVWSISYRGCLKLIKCSWAKKVFAMTLQYRYYYLHGRCPTTLLSRSFESCAPINLVLALNSKWYSINIHYDICRWWFLVYSDYKYKYIFAISYYKCLLFIAIFLNSKFITLAFPSKGYIRPGYISK